MRARQPRCLASLWCIFTLEAPYYEQLHHPAISFIVSFNVAAPTHAALLLSVFTS
ncbi:hypothetical protein CHLRE_12g499352v5 [Chlamydomonas reinhardtii]|uniref:Uncharacterized protein n=1 Tax=Chlamydomonas reinhardtii TaxID=3055 RepID=A0A2K3D3C1_CHLRE|nr:uncharacterized protein CHLRE_12g499352v5 [Chlamydomonas reinhardtii]PNW75035.1 hypothetical protein CHLRE_12g499352v5 [Chlamydomonas reinhardtii]